MSRPPYPFRHAGPCFVAGNAWCLHDDLERARAIYGDAPVIAVNGAAGEVRAFALYSMHARNFTQCRWIARQKRRFGPDFEVHASDREDNAGQPGVQYVWRDAVGGGGSAWGARKVAWLIGFEPVVLCGCPLVPGPYAGNHNLGGYMHEQHVVDDLRAGIEAEPEWHEGCMSMSGWTRELLG